MEKHLDEDPVICILALALDSEKSVYVGHYYARVGAEELPPIILTFERQNSSLIFLLALIVLPVILFMVWIAYYLKLRKT